VAQVSAQQSAVALQHVAMGGAPSLGVLQAQQPQAAMSQAPVQYLQSMQYASVQPGQAVQYPGMQPVQYPAMQPGQAMQYAAVQPGQHVQYPGMQPGMTYVAVQYPGMQPMGEWPAVVARAAVAKHPRPAPALAARSASTASGGR
jgi:hypothetical protein